MQQPQRQQEEEAPQRKLPWWFAKRPGYLYACGSFGEKGKFCLPLADASKAIDKAGHCVYPARVAVSSPSATRSKSASATKKFFYFSADTNVFAGIDEDLNLCVWGVGRAPFPRDHATILMDNVVSCDTGNNFVAAVTADGRALLFGNFNGHNCSDGAGDSPSSHFLHVTLGTAAAASPVAAVQVAACNNTAVFLGNDGVMYSAGDPLTNAQISSASSGRRGSVTAGGGSSSGSQPVFKPVTTSSGGSPLPPIRFVALGSRHGAAIAPAQSSSSGGEVLFVWGDGLSGALGLGDRACHAAPTPVPAGAFSSSAKEEDAPPSAFRHVSCTRGQADSKRFASSNGKVAGGQEGQRTHVVASDGALWIAGTTHKGMGGDHMNKTMTPEHDLLRFYRVGGKAADAKSQQPVPTGAAEDLFRTSSSSSSTTAAPSRELIARRMGMRSCDDFGRDGTTNYLSNVAIISSQPVHIHSLAVAENGQVFAWGCGSDGRTGLNAFLRGPGGSKRTMKCYVSTPSQVESLEGKDVDVVFATAGKYWSFFLVA